MHWLQPLALQFLLLPDLERHLAMDPVIELDEMIASCLCLPLESQVRHQRKNRLRLLIMLHPDVLAKTNKWQYCPLLVVF